MSRHKASEVSERAAEKELAIQYQSALLTGAKTWDGHLEGCATLFADRPCDCGKGARL